MVDLEELAGRALDAAVHRAVFERCPHDRIEYSLDGIICYGCGAEAEALPGPPHYSSDLRTGWLVVTAMLSRGFEVTLRSKAGADVGSRWWADFAQASSSSRGGAQGRTAPEALCRAAVLAIASAP